MTIIGRVYYFTKASNSLRAFNGVVFLFCYEFEHSHALFNKDNEKFGWEIGATCVYYLKIMTFFVMSA